MSATNQQRLLGGLSFVIIVILAAVLRLGYPGVNPYAGDEARLSVLALDMAQQGDIARYGIANSAGSRNFPASVYAFVIPYAISVDPLHATLYVGLLNVCAVLLFWLVVRRESDLLTATTSAGLLAAMPFAVFFSRNIWTQNLLVPMTVFWVAVTWFAVSRENSPYRPLAVMIMTFVGGIAFQVHTAAIVLVPATLYALLRWRLWRHWFPIIIGAMLATLALVPFLYHAYCCSPELLTEYLNSGNAPQVDTLMLGFIVQLIRNVGWSYLAAGDLTTADLTGWTQILSIGLVTAGVLGLLMRLIARRGSLPLIFELALLIIALPLLLFTYHTIDVRLHYALPAMVGICLFAGYAPSLIDRAWWRGITLVVTLVLVAGWSTQIIHNLQLASEQATPNGINTPLFVRRQIVQAIPDDVLAVWHTQSTDLASRGEPAIWRSLSYDRPHQITNGWSTLLLPDEPSYLLMEIEDYHAWHELRETGLMDDRFIRFDVLPGTQPHYAQPYDGSRLPPQMIAISPSVSFDNGLRVIGWYWWHDGTLLHISTVYEVTAPAPSATTLQQFTHLRFEANADAVQPDFISDLPLGAGWQLGDRLISLATFEWRDQPPASLYVDIGQYLLETGERIPVDNGGDSLRLGPFTVD